MGKNFLFDIGNVILKFDYRPAMIKIQPHAGRDLAEVRPQVTELNVLYEGGKISRAEFLQRLYEAIDYTGTEEHFVSSWADIFEENRPASELAHELKADGYPLYILSNTSCIHVDFFTRTYPVFGLFQDPVYSHIAGSLKPEPEIYHYTIQTLGIKPEETFYIDDRPENIEMGRQFGFVSHQYDYDRHDDLLKDVERFRNA